MDRLPAARDKALKIIGSLLIPGVLFGTNVKGLSARRGMREIVRDPRTGSVRSSRRASGIEEWIYNRCWDLRLGLGSRCHNLWYINTTSEWALLILRDGRCCCTYRRHVRLDLRNVLRNEL